jgi:hypothetical protein
MMTVKWVVRFEENTPLRVEESILTSIEGVFDRCKDQLRGMRLKDWTNPPDGFVICDEEGTELRRWFNLNPVHEAAISMGARKRISLQRRRQKTT